MMKSIFLSRVPLRPLLLLVLTGASFPSAFAQVAAPAAKSSDAVASEEDTLVLSPFTVSTERDAGYRATNSVGGTKTNTPIKDLPFTIDVLTNDFIRDIGALSVVEGLAYTAGVLPLDAPGHNQPNMSVRGFPSNFFLRDGIPVYRAPSWTMIDRIEVIRGASAIVYGQTQAGGVINITTKHADVTKRFGSISQLVGDWSNYVTRVDFNQPVIDKKLAVRFAGSMTDSEGRRDGYSNKGSLVFPSLTWRASDKTTVSLQFTRDISRVRGLNPGLPVNFANSKLGFHYLDQNYTAYYNSLTTAQRTIYNLPAPSTRLTAEVGGPAPKFLDQPWKYNIAGDQGYWNSDVKTTIASLSQILVAKGTGMIERSEIKGTLSRTDDHVRGSVPVINHPSPQGQRGSVTNWATLRWDPVAQNWGSDGNQWSVGSNFDGDSIDPGEQAGYYFDYNEAVIGAKNFAGSNFYFPVDLTLAANAHVVPLVGPNTYAWYPMTFHLANVNDVLSVDNVTDLNLGKRTRARVLFGFEHARQRYWDPSRKGHLPLASGSSIEAQANNYLRGLTSPGGWSSTAWGPAPGNGTTPLPNWGYGFTGFDQQNPGTIYGSGVDRAYRGWNLVNLDTGERRAAHISAEEIDAIVDKYYYGLSQDITTDALYLSGQLDLFDKKVSLLGAVRYTDIKKKDYRVFGNVPEFPQRYNPVVPQVGVVYNVSRHFNVYASYAENYWYEWSRRTNAIGEAPPPNTAESLEVGSKFDLFNGRLSGSVSVYKTKMHNLTWTDNLFDLTEYDAAANPPLLRTVDGVPQLVHRFGLSRFDAEVENKGLEFNVQARPTDSWDVVLSYSRIDSTFTRAAPWMIGLTPSGVAKNMASMWNKYTFRHAEGSLRNLEVGLGVTYRDPVFVGSGYNQTSIGQAEYVWKAPTFVRFDGTIAYPFKALGYSWRVQGNVKNIAERKNWTADASMVPDGQGREFSMTLSVNF